MKIVSLNSLPNGSPAQIMNGILEYTSFVSNGNYVYSFYPSWNKTTSKYSFCHNYGSLFGAKVSVALSILTGYHNIWYKRSTKRLLSELDKIKPDIIHLHNLHIWPINIQLLFKYIKDNHIKVVWTLHDCWPFTGHCTYFSLINCEKWKTSCFDCPKKHLYPYSLIDRSKKMYVLKKSLFTSLDCMWIVTPSIWLKSLVEVSFLKKYPIECINNGIDLNIFKPTSNSIRKRFGLENKKIVLGVSLEWGNRKGLDVFNSINDILPKDFVILLVGVDIDTRKKLKDSILSIEKTENQTELASIYSASDVFLNPTREDNFPTVNIESLACGTPVVTFNNGGSGEIIDENCGVALETEDPIAIVETLKKVVFSKNRFQAEQCVKRAHEFDAQKMFYKYLTLFDKIV